jgi:hypothetical protein
VASLGVGAHRRRDVEPDVPEVEAADAEIVGQRSVPTAVVVQREGAGPIVNDF